MGPFVEFQPHFQKRLTEILAREPSDDLLKAVARLGYLPLFPDWSGWLALCQDGGVVFVDADPPHRCETVGVERIRNIALFEGSKRYPELQPWVPQKPDDGRVCPHCQGTGILVLPNFPPRNFSRITCYCGGLGWLPSSDPG